MRNHTKSSFMFSKYCDELMIITLNRESSAVNLVIAKFKIKFCETIISFHRPYSVAVRTFSLNLMRQTQIRQISKDAQIAQLSAFYVRSELGLHHQIKTLHFRSRHERFARLLSESFAHLIAQNAIFVHA